MPNPIPPRKRPWVTCMLPAAALALCAGAFAQAVRIPSGQDMVDKAMATVSKYRGVLTASPKNFLTSKTPDAALAGNGDLGAVFGGNPESLTFFFGKNEFWTTTLWHKDFPGGQHVDGGGLMPMCRLDLSAPDLAGAAYHVEEDLARGEIHARFPKGAGGLALDAWLSARENLHVIEFQALGNTPVTVKAGLVQALDMLYHASGSSADGLWLTVSADAQLSQPAPDVKAAVRVIGAQATVAGGSLSFTVAPGAKVLLVTSIFSNTDTPDYDAAAPARVQSATAASLDGDKQAHEAWWREYWGKASIQIPDTLIEKYWYGSFYLLGCISRAGEMAPGLWGPWATSHPMGWRGDFTLNHDYQGPFLPLYSANRIEQADSYEKPLIDWIPEGQKEAQKLGFQGVLYKAHIGPMPGGTVDTNRWSELYAANFGATNMFFRWYSTYDLDYAQKIYPFLLQLDAFWQSYMKLENNRYMIYKDNIGEARTTSDVNNSLTRATLKALYKLLGELSAALGVDADKRAQWRFILDHLSPYTGEGGGIRCTETGRTGCVRTYPILYDQVFGMEAPKDTFDIGVNTVAGMGNWSGANWLCFTYMAAARSGFDGNAILGHLRNLIQTQSYANLHLISAGGGTENLANVTAPINEMLLQSHQDVIRVFSNWPKTMDASFYSMRAYGAFLVSSELQGGDVRYVLIHSEKGRDATVRNPWPGKALALYRDGVKSELLSGDKVAFHTSLGEDLILVPADRQIAVAVKTRVGPQGLKLLARGRGLYLRAPEAGAYRVTLLLPQGRVAAEYRVSGGGWLQVPADAPPGFYLARVRRLDGPRAGEDAWIGKLALY